MIEYKIQYWTWGTDNDAGRMGWLDFPNSHITDARIALELVADLETRFPGHPIRMTEVT